MRVLHLTAGNLYGGVETLLVTLAREAHRVPDMQPRFAVAFDGRLSRELAEAGHAVGQLGSVRLLRPDTVVRGRRALGALLARDACDLVVCHQPWSHVVFGPAAKRAGVPVALWLHTVSTRAHWLERWAARWPPELVVANSRFTADTAAALFPGTPVDWVHCPLPAPAPPADRVMALDARLRLRASVDTAPDEVVVVQVGRLETLKGYHVTIEALAALGPGVPAWKYWIVGGPQRPSDERVLRELWMLAHARGVADRIRVLGERGDVAAVLDAADVYCQPNVAAEAFGLSLVEALRAGLPVVTSDLGGAREIVDASCGVLAPAGDVRAVTQALERLIATPAVRAHLARGARVRPDTICEPRRQLRRVADLLRRAVYPPLAATGS